jgi:excisionase family DNA binding protein
MQQGDDHTTIRDESHGQTVNRADEDDQTAATDQATSRLGNRYTVQEAAKLLGTSVDAVRGRIRRGTIDSLKVNGVVYVLLSETSRDYHADTMTSRQSGTVGDEADSRSESIGESGLVVELKDQIDWLRREVERKDTIIMSLTHRIPELEAPVSASEEHAGGQAPPEEEKRSSWWRRFFGFENPA